MSSSLLEKLFSILLCVVAFTGVIVSAYEIQRRNDEPFNHTVILIVLIVLFLFSIFLMVRVHRIGVTANRERDEAQRQKNFLNTLLNNIPLGIFVKDARNDFRYIMMNKAAEETFGMTDSYAFGRTDYDFFPKTESDFFRQTDIKVMNGREVVEIDAEPVTSVRGMFTAHTLKVPIFDANNEAYLLLGMFEDVTDKIKNQEALRRAKEDAEKANAAKSDFLANMSHEIRTPINGVMGMAHLLKNTSLDGQQRHYAESIEHSAESLLHIINDILDFSKIEAGKMEIENIDFDFQTLCEEVSELMSIRTQEKNLEFFHRFRKECPSRLIGDPGRVRQVLLNLCSNAVKFTESGYVLLDIQQIARSDSNVTLQISIHDTGIGIASDKIQKIFDKFDQADTSNTRKYGGTGLGLAISRQLVEIMGGVLTVDSTVDKGSSFVCTISFALPDMKYQPARDQSKGKLSSLDLNVLVVDDNKISCDILEDILKSGGFNVTTERNSTNVVKKLLNPPEGKKFDFVLLDYVMPFTNGVELAFEIRKEPSLKDLLIILGTSQPTRSDNDELKESGIKGYLSKPVRSAELMQMMSMLWDVHERGEHIDMVTRYTLREAQGRKARICQKYEGVKVLVAEDNLVNQEVIAGMLENLNIFATIVPTGRHAVAAMQNSSFDIVFMDCQMPEMNGYEATEVIRKLPEPAADIPIIALTANVMKGDREKCILAGMSDYLGKPIQEEELSNMLGKWVPSAKRKEESGLSEAQDEAAQPIIPEGCDLDLAVLGKLQKSMKNRFTVLIRTFLVSSENLIGRIEAAIENQDASALRESSHSLKSAGQMGARELHRLAAELEAYAKQGQTQGLEDLVASLKREFMAVSLALQKSWVIAGNLDDQSS